jgi:hypothetical protein
MSALKLTLFSRSYCHLCDDMLAALTSLLPECNVPGDVVEVIDVDADPLLVAQYDELVPVLVGQYAGQVPVQLCHYFLDKAAVASFLMKK